MPAPHRRNTRARPSPTNSNGDRTNRDALTVGEVFESTVDDVIEMGTRLNFKGVVDIGVEFKSVALDRNGLIAVFVGNDTSESSMHVRLATRVHLDDESE